MDVILCANAASGTDLSCDTVMSFIALIVSGIAILTELFGNQRINRINLEADFYKQIYEDILIERLPKARNTMVYSNGIVSCCDDFIDEINNMRRKSLFFKYKDEKFYNTLCEKLQKLEDLLVLKSDKQLDADEYCQFTSEIKRQIDDIYDFVISKYTGKIRIRKAKK